MIINLLNDQNVPVFEKFKIIALYAIKFFYLNILN